MEISKELFVDYEVSSILASESGKDGVKRLIVVIEKIDTKPIVYFEVFKKYVSLHKTTDFESAITHYNMI